MAAAAAPSQMPAFDGVHSGRVAAARSPSYDPTSPAAGAGAGGGAAPPSPAGAAAAAGAAEVSFKDLATLVSALLDQDGADGTARPQGKPRDSPNGLCVSCQPTECAAPPRTYAAAATSAWPTEVGASSEPSTPEKSPPKPDGELEMDLLQAQVADAAESPSKKQKRTVTPESGAAGSAANGASAGPAPLQQSFVMPPAAGQQVGPGSMTAGQMPSSGVLPSAQPWLLQTVAGAMSAGNQGNQVLLSPQGFSGGTGQSPRIFVPPEHAQLPLPASGARFQQPASFSGGAGQSPRMHPGQPRFGPPPSRPRNSGAPSSLHVGLPDQCPVRKSQGKVRENNPGLGCHLQSTSSRVKCQSL